MDEQASEPHLNPDDVTKEALRERSLAVLDSENRAELPRIVPWITNLLLDRTAAVVWSLTPPQLNGWSKQRALALLVASISGGRLPGWADAERPGQRMHEFLGRYRDRHKKMMKAEKESARRARAAGRPANNDISRERLAWEQEEYKCTFGCTPFIAPVRLVAPGKRPRQVEYVQSSVFEENLKLRKENNSLRDKETAAILMLQSELRQVNHDLASSVTTESSVLHALEAEREKVQLGDQTREQLYLSAKALKMDNKILAQQLESKEKTAKVLTAKIARAHLDAALALKANEKVVQKMELQLSSKDVSYDVKSREIAELRQKLSEKEKDCSSLEMRCLRLGGIIAQVHREAAATQAKLEKRISKYEKHNLQLQSKLDTQRELVDSMRRLKNKMAERKRSAEARASTSARMKERAQTAERQLSELRADYEALCEQMECAESMSDSDEVENIHPGGRRDARGCFRAEPASMRVLKWAQLARNVPSSSVNANIVEVLRVYAPKAICAQPCERQLRKMRGELTIAGEAIAAFKIAKAVRIVSFGFDESTKFGISLLSSNVQIEPHTHPSTIVDVVPRGATIAAGGTAAKVSALIERKIFRHCRTLLEKWRFVHESKYGVGAWRADGGPSVENVGLHRLCENTLLMSDTCNAATATKRLVAEMAIQAAKAHIGEEEWDAMDTSERDATHKVWLGDCHQHIRNIIINSMASGATAHLKAELAEDLADFSSFDRMSVDGMDLIRAVFKELHSSGEYAKGKGREFHKWCATFFTSFPLMPFERVAGSRQDLAFDGAVAIFWNRLVVLEFLQGLVNIPNADNKLEKFLSSVLRCNEITALLRTCTVFKFVLSEPMRWLAGKGSTLPGWSIVCANEVLDLAYQALIDIAADGSILFDPEFLPFDAIANKLPQFRDWCAQHPKERTITSADGQQHLIYQLVLDEARTPTRGGTEQATEMAITLAEKMAQQGLVAMRDPRRAIADKLSALDGEMAVEKCRTMHEKTKGAHITNDRVEKNFAIYDVLCRMCRNAPVENLSGMAQQKTAHDFEMAPIVAHDRRRAKAAAVMDSSVVTDGYFWSVLNEQMQESLVEMARYNAEDARRAGREALREQDEERMARREERVVQLLNKAVDDYAYAKELYVQWTNQRATTAEQIRQAIRDKPEARQLEYLRLQIEMRVLGVGLTEYATQWSSSSDSNIGTVAHLRDLLIRTILPAERNMEQHDELPTEAQPPQSVPKKLQKLGTIDVDAIEIEKKSLFSEDELKQKVEAAMLRRVQAGIADDVEKLQPQLPPPFNQELVGKRLEVCWKYFQQDTGNPMLIWTSGTVKRVADGLTNKRSPRARAILPGGALLWAWDEDSQFNEKAGEQWLILLPSKWNPSRACLYGWRYDPSELR